jgi:hypothetical protein
MKPEKRAGEGSEFRSMVGKMIKNNGPLSLSEGFISTEKAKLSRA